ncbi:LppP/LprE family lipoprotein [Tsukamurella sp. DT100]|uniref:LppP/LprE family lipoprotein n=1 Tax=Tsukamurella sp. DT100 TaxID=3393415 RepID=UPI003CF5CAD9
MIRTSKAAIALVAALALTGGCGDGSTTAGDAPSTFAAPATSAQAGTGEARAGATTPPGAGGDSGPVTQGSGKCLDLSSSTVRDAVAKLPSFRGSGFTATRGTDAREGSCPALMWARADLTGGTGSSPVWILFFDRQGYLGTATSRYTTFTGVFGSTDDSVAVSYRWLNPGDSTAGVSGGPVIVTYTLSGRTVTPDKDVPPQVFDGGAPAPTSTAPTATPAPVSHCSEATPETLGANAEMNWGAQIVKPFTVDSVACVDDWATARIPARDAYPQSAKLLFRYTGGGWSGVAFGSGFSCTEKGVPAAIAARLGC